LLSNPRSSPYQPPLVNISIHEVGLRLGNVAKFRDVPFEFNVIGNTGPLTPAELSDESTNFHFEAMLSLGRRHPQFRHPQQQDPREKLTLRKSEGGEHQRANSST